MSKNLREAIDKGLRFLDKSQEKDGSFMCLVSTKFDNYRNAKTVPAIVPPNIVLSSLIHIKGNGVADKIKKRTAEFLLGERSAYWSFNYWFRKSDWFKKEPYPDDLDDTFCALAALYEYNPALFDGKVMAKIVTMLTSAEKKEGGPYDMWLVPPEGRKTWDDTDLVVNSNIAFFLSLQDITLPNLNAFIEKSIDKKDYEFPYNRIYPGLYFISRFYNPAPHEATKDEGRVRRIKNMVDLLLSKREPDGKWENPLRTALAVSALMNLSGAKYRPQIEKGIRYLLKTQSKSGSWEPASFYFQMRTEKKTLYAGDPSITTALCLEAINKFALLDSYEGKTLEGKKPLHNSSGALKIHREIAKEVRNRFAMCDKDLKREAFKIIAKTLRGDKDKQIVLLPYFFRSSLGKFGKNISDSLIIKLGVANLFGWIAYTIYDNFLDNEGEPNLLSVANLSLRESSSGFSSILPKESLFAEFSVRIFDAIDSANTWEIANSRFDINKPTTIKNLPDYGDYSQLAMKSFGHSLGPLAILFSLGYKENSSEVKNVTQFFKHYIIARQLNDDAHDWEDDLKNGHINAVAVQLLEDERSVNPQFKLQRADKSGSLQKTFWGKTIVGVCKDIMKYTKLARQDLKKVSVIKDTAMFEKLLASIELSAQKALKERAETIKFLKTYKPY